MSAVATSSDDLALMRRIAERDSAAMRTLYDRHAGLVYAIALKMLKNRDDAEELVADVYWELWDKASRYDQTRSAPSTYIVTLARSRAIDRLRRRAGKGMVSLDASTAPQSPSAEPNPLQVSEFSEQAQLVRQALAELEPNQREAIESAYYDGLSQSEIADKLHKPLGTIKTYIRQGLIRLRETLRKTDRDVS